LVTAAGKLLAPLACFFTLDVRVIRVALLAEAAKHEETSRLLG